MQKDELSCFVLLSFWSILLMLGICFYTARHTFFNRNRILTSIVRNSTILLFSGS